MLAKEESDKKEGLVIRVGQWGPNQTLVIAKKNKATIGLTLTGCLLGCKPIGVLGQHTKTSNHESGKSLLVMK